MISLEADAVPLWVNLNHIYIYSFSDEKDDSPFQKMIDMEVIHLFSKSRKYL